MNKEYIYEYVNGKPARNLGFLKVDKQLDKCVIQIYARDIDEVKGIVFQTSDGRRYLAGWDPEQPDVSQMQQPPQMETSQPQPPQMETSQPQPPQAETPQPPQPQPPRTEPQQPPQPTTQKPNKQEEAPETEEFLSPRNTIYEKIQRKELSRLPRKEWRIANNSFLLHGFYNYHHLLYIEEDGEVWVGVPGIFHEKEKLAANTFGFTHFRRQADIPVELSQQERNDYEDFGYWCRQIPVPKV